MIVLGGINIFEEGFFEGNNLLFRSELGGEKMEKSKDETVCIGREDEMKEITKMWKDNKICINELEYKLFH